MAWRLSICTKKDTESSLLWPMTTPPFVVGPISLTKRCMAFEESSADPPTGDTDEVQKPVLTAVNDLLRKVFKLDLAAMPRKFLSNLHNVLLSISSYNEYQLSLSYPKCSSNPAVAWPIPEFAQSPPLESSPVPAISSSPSVLLPQHSKSYPHLFLYAQNMLLLDEPVEGTLHWQSSLRKIHGF